MENFSGPETELELEAMNEITSGIGVFDLTGSVIKMAYLNDGFYRMIGARREDRARFFAEGTIQSVHPDDRAGLLSEAKTSIREKRSFEYRFRNLNGGGKYIWIGIRASHKPVGENTERFYASYYNVDQYVSERDELAAFGKRLDSILGNIPGGVAVFYEQRNEIRLVYTNAGFFALHHGSEEYWSGQSKNPADWLTPEDRHLFWDEFDSVVQKKKEQGSVIYRIVGEDGKLHWVSNQFRPAEQVDGVQYYYASFIDMDKQIAAEQELLRDKQMYDDAAKSARLFIWSYDIETHRAIMMQSGYTLDTSRILGLPQIIDKIPDSLLPFIVPEDRKAFADAYHSIDAGAPYAECEICYQMPAQETKQYERIVLKRICDPKGRLLSVYCYGLNITKQKLEEERFNRAYEQIDNPNLYGAFHLNLTKNWCGNGTAGKSRMHAVLDLEKSGTVDGYFTAFSEFIADDDVRADFFRRIDREKLLNLFEKGTERISMEYPVIHENGDRHWREGFLNMIKNPNTGDVEAVTYSYDIDARKRDEFIVDKLIHDHFDYIGIIHPHTGTFEFRSRRPWIAYGKIGEMLSYEKCVEYVSARFRRDDERRTFEETVALPAILQDMNENGIRSSFYLNTVGEKPSCIRLQYSWLEKPGGDILVVRSDITEAYRKEQKQMKLLETEKKAAEAANVAKSDFLSRMSHDIRTPLNGIIGMTYLTKRMDLPEKALDNLSKIDTSSKFLLGLVNDILDMSKMESRTIELHPEPYPFEDFRAYLDAVICPLCKEKQQTFLLDVNPIPGYTPLVDITRLNRIYFNLLSNAVKYTPEGGTITLKIREVFLSDERIRFTLMVKDNGIGMSSEFQKHLFEPFVQENRDDNSEMRGSGLGLAIVKKTVEAMSGTVSVISKKGEGTEFTVVISSPCIRKTVLKERENLPDKEGLACLSEKHVLLCEDHPLNQEIVCALLREKGMLVQTAEDGQKGVDQFSSSPIGFFDCILMDLRMPVMDGLEAVRTIRAMERPDAKTVPVIAMTADAFADDVKKCLAAGMNDHIAKPIEPDRLYRILQTELRHGKENL